MQYKNNSKVGKIIRYDGYFGEIATPYETYYFTRNELEKLKENINIQKGDLVIFDSKTEKDFPQAYFVKKIELIYKKK